MSNSYFLFKQFAVHHDLCSMKVGTDGVLLGAWVDVQHARSVLDVGTGSGLIALMVAQRNRNAEITAIDIDNMAVMQAVDNVKRSPFDGQIAVRRISVQDLAQEGHRSYDCIVCNPPFFENALKSPDDRRSIARHDGLLPMEELFVSAKRLLSENGRLSLIIPCHRFEKAENCAGEMSLWTTRVMWVKPLPNSEPKRVMVEFSNVSRPPVIEEMVIEISRHNYSPEYIDLTREFYLKM